MKTITRLLSIALVSMATLTGCGGSGDGCASLLFACTPPTLGTDTSISKLSVSNATLVPAFNPSVFSYTASVQNSIINILVLASTKDRNATLRISGRIKNLVVGDNTISILVTAENGTTTRAYTIVVTRLTFVQEAYIKASNTDVMDQFGQSVALSGDGNTLAVGAVGEGSAATGVNGNQADNSASVAGAVYVFR